MGLISCCICCKIISRAFSMLEIGAAPPRNIGATHMSNGDGIRKSRTCTPAALWREIEREAGPLDQIDYDGLKRALDLALVEAIGENVVSVPQIVAKRMLADFLAQQRG